MENVSNLIMVFTLVFVPSLFLWLAVSSRKLCRISDVGTKDLETTQFERYVMGRMRDEFNYSLGGKK